MMTMPNMIRKIVRGAKRRIRQGRKDARTHAIHEAGERLLARYDYDLISVAKVAKEAGCSVGAFYERFPDKDAFLSRLIGDVFNQATDAANQELSGGKYWPKPSASGAVHQIVQHVVIRMTGRKTAGVTRAAVKLGATKPSALEPFLEYRAAVTDRAIALLAPRLSIANARRPIKEAMQIIFATVIDATLRDAWPLRAGSHKMTNALSSLMLGHLGQDSADLVLEAGNNDEEEIPRESVEETEEPPELPEGRIPVFDVDLRVYRGSVAGSIKSRNSRQRGFNAQTGSGGAPGAKRTKHSIGQAVISKKVGATDKRAEVPVTRPPRIPIPVEKRDDENAASGKTKRKRRLI